MQRFTRVRLLIIFLAMFAVPASFAIAESVAIAHSQETPSTIVVGFVGGFVRHNNPHHGPVQFAHRLQQTASKSVYVQVFENRHRSTAYNTIVRLLDRNRDGILSPDEKAQARIVLYGQSWGATAVVLLARQLNRAGIPVLLTVQVDSVPKLWQNDRIIPENVAAAANFYQPHGLIHGQRKIVAADPTRTQILGNFLFDYQQTPVKCEGYSWTDRTLVRSHMESECDPHLWSQVEDLVRQRLNPQNLDFQSVQTQPSPVAALPQR